METALHYARHAVAIEFHPFPLTTLGKLLFRQMERNPVSQDIAFVEAFEKLSAAIQKEQFRSRIAIHPFSTLFSGTVRYLELGGALSTAQQEELTTHADNARYYFGNDPMLQTALNRLDALL